MQSFPPTIVIRHRLENLKKCSLRGHESRPDFRFFTYPDPKLPELKQHILLTLDAPPLSKEDANQGLIILDATWRYAAKMLKSIDSQAPFIYRSIPCHFRTAYPRCQHDCPDPERGLASIEAIYLSYFLLGRDLSGLLDHYYWKEKFLIINQLDKLN